MNDPAELSDTTTPIAALKATLSRFNADRGWGRFHTPQHLAMALSAESAELLELFLWKQEADLPRRERLAEEMADVLICLVNLANRLDLDLMAATADKLVKNAAKYPVASSFGNATKWDALDKAAAPSSESNVKESPTTGTDP
jgi:NTP pyrophosphatase (non-canonical NTP hydrolase)